MARRPGVRTSIGVAALLLWSFAISLPGCVDDSEVPKGNEEASLPVFEDASDFSEIQLQLAPVTICPAGVTATMTFETRNQAFGMAVLAGAGQTVVAETRQPVEGDAVDTIVALYGPDDGSGFFGALPVAVDDDSGVGPLSRLTATVDDAGSYFVVVTTSGGVGLGETTLAVTGDGCEDEPCSDDAVCDDGDPCTTDVCDATTGQCSHTTDPNCGGCDATVCVTTNPCEQALCVDGACQLLSEPDGLACDDGDPCTVDDVCTAGLCAGRAVPGCGHPCAADEECDDGDSCTDDACDPTTGGCVNVPIPGCGLVCVADDQCDDGDDCTRDVCDPTTGACVHTTDPSCGGCDATVCVTTNPCEQALCVDGACQLFSEPDGLACDDGDPCTADDACTDGMCAGLPVPGCGHPCGTDDECEDGDPCTFDVCDATTGQCLSTPLDCDDGDSCTDDACDATTGGCVNVPIPGCGLVCVADDQCDDGDDCTRDFCDPATGACVHTTDPNCGGCDATACATTNPCEQALCVDGVCQLVAEPDGLACDDGDPCTADDACTDGMCAGLPVPGCGHPCGADEECDDGDDCTQDTCDPMTGQCLHVTDPNCGCDCPAPSPCHTAMCVDGVCEAIALPDGTPCDDGIACTEGDVCVAGLCAGAPLSCDDANSCTVDSCHPDVGCVYSMSSEGVLCDDGDLCTTGDACGDGVCVGAPRICDDGDPCTQDACDPTHGCVHTPDPACE